MAFDEESPPGTPASKFSEDFFEHEDKIPGILSSLIDQQKLQKAWDKKGKRLKTAETNLTEAQTRLDRLPSEYVSLPAYQELVEKQHSSQLVAHTENLARLDELTGRLSTTVFDTHENQVQDCLGRLKRQEEQQLRSQQEAAESSKRFEDFRDMIVARLDALDSRVQDNKKELDGKHAELKEQQEVGFDKLWKEMKGAENRMQAYCEGKVERCVKDKLNFDKDTGKEEKQKLIRLIDAELTQSLRLDQQKTTERLLKLSVDVENQRSDLMRTIRHAEVKASEAVTSLKSYKQEMHADLEKRPYTTDITKLEMNLRKDLNHLNLVCEGLQTRTILKLNEFVDHVGKLHEAIDDHEHCLRHHAEEIENRSTKYDLLLCQSQIDKCVAQEDYTTEVQDLKKVIAWQTNKIENFGLGGGGGFEKVGRGHHRHKRRQSAGSYRGVSHSRASMGSSLSNRSGQNQARSMTQDGFLADNMEASLDEGATEGSAGREKNHPIDATAEDDGAGSPRGSVSKESVQSPDPSPDEEFDDDRSVMSASTSSVLASQVEALAMALVGMAHLVLAPPKLGASSHTKNEHKAEMLAQLGDLRHWITHKTMPPGWDPSKLTTIALRFAHQAPTRKKANRESTPEKMVSAKKAHAESSGDEGHKRKMQGNDSVASLERKMWSEKLSTRNSISMVKGQDLEEIASNIANFEALKLGAGPGAGEQRLEPGANTASGGNFGTFRPLQSARERRKSRAKLGKNEVGSLPPLAGSANMADLIQSAR